MTKLENRARALFTYSDYLNIIKNASRCRLNSEFEALYIKTIHRSS